MSEPTPSKTCRKCGQTKPLDEFSLDRRSKSGRGARCRVCETARSREVSPEARKKYLDNWHEQVRESLEHVTEHTTKTCNECGETKLLSLFNLDRNGRYGHTSRCKACCCVAGARFEKAHPDRTKAWNRENHERVRANQTRWKQENYEHVAAKRAEWYKINHKLVTEQMARWRKANPERNISISQRRRARQIDAFVAEVDILIIYERDGWRCGLCGEDVERDRKAPHPLSPSLDHVIPLSVGGTHEPANCQLAHLRCNIVKGNRL